MIQRLVVVARWDDQGHRWSATSADIAGLSTSAATLDALREQVLEAAPILIDETGIDASDDRVEIRIE
jgi:hypothetical protein